MTKAEMIRRHRAAIEEHLKRPPKERFADMVRRGVINEQGEVIFLERMNREAGFEEPPAADEGR